MRKINEKLIDRMTKGDLLPLLNYVKSDNDLRLEVRRNGEAFIYYRKGKALEIGSLKVDKKYENLPPTEMAVTNPSGYFSLTKKAIDNWLKNRKERKEFDTQQNIAKFNQDKDDKYVILDMEYVFEQEQIGKDKREKTAQFDLLGIERKTNKIVFFEVKKGMRATKGRSGIKEHIRDFKKYLFGKNSELFRKNLIRDIKNIIEDKKKLGLLDNYTFSGNYENKDPELIFVFHPDNDSQVKEFSKILDNECKLIIVSNSNYKLG